MRDATQKQADTRQVEDAAESLIDFPCDFPIKVMGLADDAFVALVEGIFRRHDPEFSAAKLRQRASAGGKYVALTGTVRATSKAMLDDLYRELSTHPAIRYVL
jgi:putative lipoic acid-binding regulatory protein